MRIHEIPLLSPLQLHQIKELLAQPNAVFTDGKRTAGVLSNKQNTQLDRDFDRPLTERLDLIIMNAIKANARLTNFVLPVKVTSPRYACYNQGDHYREHNDNPFIRHGDSHCRTDVSMTIFLSPPEDYQGGELVIRLGDKCLSFKPAAGTAVVYPSGADHAVAAVAGGQRRVVVMWFQSRIPEGDRRELLDDIGTLSESLTKNGQTQEAQIAERAYGNLLRMWSQA